ncbi:MAG: type II toxin-antitoxin system Phd/YefM family antitoxin [Phycisphaerae bacterium]|nr:type II toxin-antitoxin system Phd/YefM family antitoxin [Phycisphaerae bacterium]
MTTISFTNARARLSQLFTDVCTKHERIVVERHGSQRVAIVPIEDIEALEQLREDQRDLAEAEAAWDESEDTIPWDEVKQELGL